MRRPSHLTRLRAREPGCVRAWDACYGPCACRRTHVCGVPVVNTIVQLATATWEKQKSKRRQLDHHHHHHHHTRAQGFLLQTLWPPGASPRFHAFVLDLLVSCLVALTSSTAIIGVHCSLRLRLLLLVGIGARGEQEPKHAHCCVAAPVWCLPDRWLLLLSWKPITVALFRLIYKHSFERG